MRIDTVVVSAHGDASEVGGTIIYRNIWRIGRWRFLILQRRMADERKEENVMGVVYARIYIEMYVCLCVCMYDIFF